MIRYWQRCMVATCLKTPMIWVSSRIQWTVKETCIKESTQSLVGCSSAWNKMTVGKRILSRRIMRGTLSSLAPASWSSRLYDPYNSWLSSSSGPRYSLWNEYAEIWTIPTFWLFNGEQEEKGNRTRWLCSKLVTRRLTLMSSLTQ